MASEDPSLPTSPEAILQAPPAAPGPLGWKAYALAALSGLLMVLAFPGPALQPLAYVALVPFLLQLFKAQRKRQKVALFATYGGVFHLGLVCWFVAMHPLTWLGFSWWASLGVVFFAWLGVSLGLTIQVVVLGVLYSLATRKSAEVASYHVAVLACGWTAMEWLASLGIFGFTWSNLALSQVAWLPAVQGIELTGPYPVALLVVMLNGALALGFHLGWNQPQVRLTLASAIFLWLGWLGYGFGRLNQLEAQLAQAPKHNVGIVQGNIHGGEKFDRGEGAVYRMATHYLALSDQLATASLVVWPETSMPAFLRNDQRLLSMISTSASQHKRHMFVGALDWSGSQATKDLTLHNAVALVSPEGRLVGMDNKRHLVPYGEFVPWRAYMPDFLTHINILANDFSPGEGAKVFDTPLGVLGAGVCYDGIFPDAMRPPVEKGAQVLALVTNDAWYKDTSAPRVLSAHAQLRAIESRRFIIRAANTGISSIIEPTGRLQAQTGLYVDAVLSGTVSPLSGLTAYMKLGDLLAYLLAGLFGFALLWGGSRPRRLEA